MSKPMIYRFLESVAAQMQAHTPGEIQPLPPLNAQQQALFEAAGEHIVTSREAERKGDMAEAHSHIHAFTTAYLAFLETLPDAPE